METGIQSSKSGAYSTGTPSPYEVQSGLGKCRRGDGIMVVKVEGFRYDYVESEGFMAT